MRLTRLLNVKTVENTVTDHEIALMRPTNSPAFCAARIRMTLFLAMPKLASNAIKSVMRPAHAMRKTSLNAGYAGLTATKISDASRSGILYHLKRRNFGIN